MLLMPGNHASWFVHHWNALCPGLFAHLWSPPRNINVYPYLDYALDNYRYAAMQNGQFWGARDFRNWLKQIKYLTKLPLFLVVPDVPRNARATLEEWEVWESELRKLKVPLAFAVQNGIRLEQVPQTADWIFVGGSDDWRYPRLREFTATGRPVHVGRVNTLKRIRQCDQAGVMSVDGNGWFRGDEYQQLLPYIQERQARLVQSQPPGGWGVRSVTGSGVKTGVAWAATQEWEQQTMRFPQPGLVPINRRWGRQIPANITSDHLKLAMENWRMWVEPGQMWLNGKSQHYAVQYQGCLYPPKQVISVANIYANGEFLPVQSFSGGKRCNRFLEQRGLKVVLLREEVGEFLP